MKKLYFFLAVFLLALSVSSAEQVKMNLSEGAYPVNRVDSIVWLDISVANSEIVKEIIFDFSLEFVDANGIAHVIPARPVLANGETDISKWTQVAGSQLKYWMDPNKPNDFLPRSEVSRKIMEFFIKFDTEIPIYGAMIVRFNNFRILGVDGGNTINLTGPSEVSIRIEFGQRPPDERPDSVKINFSSVLNKPAGELKLNLAYLSKYSLGRAVFNLGVPSDLLAPILTWPPADGRDGQLQKISSDNGRDNYALVITSTASPYPISTGYETLADIVLLIPSEAYGLKQITINGLALTDGVGVALKSEQNFSLTVNLGDSLPPPRTKDSLFLDAIYLIDSVNHEVRVNVAYWGASWDTLSFDLNLPSGIVLSKVEPGLLSMSAEVIGSHVVVNSRYLLPKTRPNDWHHTFSLIFKYDNARGIKRVIIYNTAAQREDTTIVVANSLLIVDIDFGTSEDTSGVIVKYFLATPTDWFFLDSRPADNGRLKLLLMMDNVVETTDVLQFRVVLPSTMSLSKIIPLDLNGRPDSKLIDINFLYERDGKNYYAVLYSSLSSVLLPNYASRNPRAIMELEIEFSDICPGITAITVDNIVASGLDGRPLSATKKISLPLNFDQIFQSGLFKRGDIDLNFGNFKLEIADWHIGRKILDKEIIPTCYQRWALDLDSNGVLDAHDLSILESKLFTGVEDRPPGDLEPADSVYTCGYYLYYRIFSANWELLIYDYMGRPITETTGKIGEGSVNLENLKNGLYFYRLKIGDKIMTNKFFITY